jgi:N-acetylmuramoyl-L-alanine amidase
MGFPSTPSRWSSRPSRRIFSLVLLAVGLLVGEVPAQETLTVTYRGQSHPVRTAMGDIHVGDAAKALGFQATEDPATGTLTLTGHDHRVLVGSGTASVPVDQRFVEISKAVRKAPEGLFAPPDFLEKVLFPLAAVSGSWDASRRTWTVTESGGSLSVDVAVVHSAPTTQVVFRLSGPSRFAVNLTGSGFELRFPGRRVLPAFPDRRYEDPLVAAVRFAGETATIEFRSPGLAARAYPLVGPDRVVVEIAPAPAAALPEPVAPAPLPARAPAPPITIVVDAGHGGAETGAIGPGGLMEKDVTLQVARRLAAAIPRHLAARVVLSREDDTAVTHDDRTAVANHEKADLFLSIHANSSRYAGARGSETYYLSLEASDKLAQEVANQENLAAGSPVAGAAAGNGDLDFILWDLAQSAHLKESAELAEDIQDELNALGGTENRGIKQAPFRVLVGATMPAVLVEVAFISNPEEEKKLRSATFQEDAAVAISRAVAKFFARRRSAPVTPATPGAAATPTPTPRP